MGSDELAQRRVSRRQVLGWAAGSIVVTAFGAGLAPGAGVPTARAAADTVDTATVTGVVLAEAGGAGRRPLADVLISDGKTVVRTDQDGRYSLSIDPHRRLTDYVFLALPDGYHVPLDRARTPQFYGALDALVAGQVRQLDFTLTRDPDQGEGQGRQDGRGGEFIHLTDVHVSGDYGTGLAYERERFRKQIQQLNALSQSPEFILLSGDLSNRGRDEEYQAYQDAAADAKYPIWTSVGNHEWGGNGEDPANYSQEIEHYRHYQGPEWYSFNYRGYHIVVLEDYNAGDLNPEHVPGVVPNDDQLVWLRQDLAAVGPECPLIVIAHVAMNDPLTIPGTAKYITLLRQYNVKLVLSGHTHRNDVDPNVFPGGYHVVTEPAWSPQDGGPVGFRRVRIGEDGALRFPFKAFDIARRLVLVHPAPDQQVAADAPLLVQLNAYNTTTEVDRAEYRIDDGPWHKLRPDGVWTWSDERDGPLAAGAHRIEARVRDDAGQSWDVIQGRFAAVAAAQLPPPRAGANWSTFHGDNAHSGRAADVVRPPLRLAWSYRSGGAILASSPVVVDGVAYIGIKDEHGVDRNGVVALDVATGRERWRRQTDAAVDGTPSVADGRVHVSSIRGTVHAFDARTGATLWERRFGVQEDGVQRWWAYACPIVAGGLVYQSMGFVLLALDARTGEERWRFNGGGANSYFGMPALSEDGRLVYFTSKGDAIWALDAATGRQVWRKDPVGGLYRSTVAVAGGIVYARTGDLVLAVDGATGAEVRRYAGLGYTHNQESPAVADGLLVSPGNRKVAAYDLASGAQVWSAPLPGEVSGSPAISGDTVYIGAHDGLLYALDQGTGAVRWRYELGPWVKSSPAVSGNAVLVGAYDGNLYCFTGVAG